MRKETAVFIASIAGGALAGLAWMPFFSGITILLAFIPFFMLASLTRPDHHRFGNRLLFIMILPGFLIFNTAE